MTPSGDPPLGTVTCLFSDIEGSTALELDIGTAGYRDVLERHQALLRAAFTTHAGHEQGTEGDSFFVIFRNATEAVAAAADAQRALAVEAWPDGRSVKVRMGINTGELEGTSDGVIGHAINRTARITSAAHGGQVLLGGPTRALVAGDLPPGVTLRDLGEFRLKDLREPEPLTQLVIDDLPADFPPPRAPDARPNNLPTQLTTFVGRERELDEAIALLSRTRLLTLTGPGGTGKTRLSIQVAAAAADDFPEGLWFVALDAVRDDSMVAPTIARTLGLADNLRRTPLEAVIETIGQGRVLLVLDNFEQVVAAGPVVAELLRGCPNVRCIVSTRIALHVSGEQEYPVPGLPAPPDVAGLSEVDRLNLPRALREFDVDALTEFEAVRLFVARASAVRPSFEVTAANAPAVAGITARLHGMPLAIELAAARSKLLTPDQILARLDRHLAVLTAGARDLPERQQTLRGAIAWSYDLLDPGARRTLDRLSLFRGGADIEHAEVVCGPATEIGGEVLDRLEELVDQSLVRLDEAADAPRFTMLETIREYAAEMLVAGDEADEIARRHGEAMLALAEAAAPHLAGADQREWLDRLERDHDNLRAALDWLADHDPSKAARLAFAMWRLWQQRGYLNEGRARMEALAARDWRLEPVDRARFAEAFGGIAYWQSDEATARRWYDEALAIWRELGDERELANALYNRAYADMVVIMDGRGTPQTLAESKPMMDDALAIYRRIGDVSGEGSVIWGLGSFHYFTADAAAGEVWFRQALELQRAAGNRTMEAWALHMLALSMIGQAKFDEARQTADHALRHFVDAGDISGVILVLDDLAIVAANAGDLERGGRLYGAARHLQRSTGTALADYVEQNALLFGISSPRDLVGPADLDRLMAEGAAMSLDELVRYALDAGDGMLPDTHEET